MASIVNGLWKLTSINCDIHSLNREYGWRRVRLTNVSGIGTDCIHVLGQAYIIKLIYDHRHCSPITPPSPPYQNVYFMPWCTEVHEHCTKIDILQILLN